MARIEMRWTGCRVRGNRNAMRSFARPLPRKTMNNDLLDGISVASPCPVQWSQMQGDERKRLCAQCKLHVHNLSAMSRRDANELLQRGREGRVCVRFFRREDGTVLTRDCPVGLRRKLRRAWARAAAMWLALWGSATACVRQASPVAPQTEPREWRGEAVMGDMVVPQKPELREVVGIAAPEPAKTPEPPKSPEPPKKN